MAQYLRKPTERKKGGASTQGKRRNMDMTQKKKGRYLRIHTGIEVRICSKKNHGNYLKEMRSGRSVSGKVVSAIQKKKGIEESILREDITRP